MIKRGIMLLCAILCAGAVEAQQVIIDKIVAVVGNSAIYYSDVVETADRLVQQRREMGYTSDRDPKNEALEQLMLQKLLYHQSQIDSVDVKRAEVAVPVENVIQNMISEAGSIGALEAQEHKAVYDIRETMIQQYVEMQSAEAMQRTIMDKVEITPGEVERFYKSQPKDSLPIVPEQYVYAHITKFPSSMDEAKRRVRERLLDMRERIISGKASFATLARMYSEDGSAVRGGELEPMPLDGFVKPFANALEKLKPDQISEVVETEFGFHIIQGIERLPNNTYRCRHILIRPYYTPSELAESDQLLDSLANLIRCDSITFEKAAMEHSDDPYSKQNGGLVSNHDILEAQQAYQASLTQTKFYKEYLMPADYNAIRRLKKGEISDAFQTMDLKNNQLSKIIKLIDVIPSHTATLDEDYLMIEEAALEHKKRAEYNKWLTGKIQSMYVRIEPEFREGEWEYEGWVK
ncbi:MAG: peptidylprolyl isomerase [Rikenellaceae bacterium]|nr:peptidylprolyl isomerase [Rikenellaceae bacterium]MBR2419439.1 peptidylprolyl isomerase [Rikenellaceae bacterium]MBR2932444.1 peptidylprolyl isomerase [Rikenellaceae bacterium]